MVAAATKSQTDDRHSHDDRCFRRRTIFRFCRVTNNPWGRFKATRDRPQGFDKKDMAQAAHPYGRVDGMEFMRLRRPMRARNVSPAHDIDLFLRFTGAETKLFDNGCLIEGALVERLQFGLDVINRRQRRCAFQRGFCY
jgi:hypothetical protein